MSRKLLFMVAAIWASVIDAAELPYPVIFIHGLSSSDQTWNELLTGTFGNAFVDATAPSFDILANSSLNSTNLWGLDGNPNTDDDDVLIENPDGQTIPNSPIYRVNFDCWRTEGQTPYDVLPHVALPSSYEDDYSRSNESALMKQAYALGIVIGRVLSATGKEKVILVGHSAGGVVAREYLQRTDASGNHLWWVEPVQPNGHHVAKLLTTGSPHLGSNFGQITRDTHTLRSELLRDLRYSYDPDDDPRGVLLFGGTETDASNEGFHNGDVNCDGDILDTIVGLSNWDDNCDNPLMSLPPGIEYQWVISDWEYSIGGDAVVDLDRQWLHNWPDTILVHLFHNNEPEDDVSIIRGLDSDETIAWQINDWTTYMGWFTYQSNAWNENNNSDIDVYRINLPNPVTVDISAVMDLHEGICVVRDEQGVEILNQPFDIVLDATLGYLTTSFLTIEFHGVATENSWQFPYQFSVYTSDVTPPFQVSDLTLFRNELNGYVSWTATGDDGVDGRAIHTLRMSTEPLTEFNFDNATLLYQDEHLGGGINGAFFTFPFTDETYYIAMTVCDEAGNCSGLSNLLTEYIPPGEIPQGNYISAAEYFIDTDPGPGNGVSLPITAGQSPFGNWTIPVSSLGHGVHHLYLRMRDDDGRWFSPMRRSFVVTAPQLTTVPTNIRAEISFDQEPNGTNDVDLIVAPDWVVVANLESSPSALDLGPHDLYLRFVYNDTLISAPQRRSFRVTPPLPEGGQRIVAAEYFTDNDPGEGLGWLLEPDEIENVTIAANFPADTMSPGMHELNLRVRSADGIWSSPARRTFHVGRWGSILTDAEYFWDTDPGNGLGQAIDFSDAYDVVLTPEVSVPVFAPGVHSFSVRFRSLLGEWSGPARRSIHIRPEIPAGGYAISNAEAFIDTDPGVAQGIVVQATDGTLDEADEVLLRYASPIGLGVGNHTAYMRIQDNTGRWSTLARDSLAVVPPVEVTLTAFADSLGDSLRLRWNSFPEALTYAVHWDTLATGAYVSVIPVQPPDTLLAWPLDQSPKRFFYVTAMLPDSTVTRQSFLKSSPVYRRLP